MQPDALERGTTSRPNLTSGVSAARAAGVSVRARQVASAATVRTGNRGADAGMGELSGAGDHRGAGGAGARAGHAAFPIAAPARKRVGRQRAVPSHGRGRVGSFTDGAPGIDDGLAFEPRRRAA
jgi:hypothetical protein